MSSSSGRDLPERARQAPGTILDRTLGRSSDVETPAGFRRVDWVRLWIDRDRVSAEAVGVGYRLPATRPIPLATAVELLAAGIPHVTRVVRDRATGGVSA